MKLRTLTTLLLSCWFAVSCVFGIPDYDHNIEPEADKPCTPVYVDGVVRACLSEEDMEKWVRKNLPVSP